MVVRTGGVELRVLDPVGCLESRVHNLYNLPGRNDASGLKRVRLAIEEEVDAGALFPGAVLHTRSKRPKIDIVAKRAGIIVALLSVRWRLRHDRVDVVDEAQSYVPPARRQNPDCKFYAVLGEFAPSRLEKVLSNSFSSTFPNAAISATVHFLPDLITNPGSLAENGRLTNLRSLAWLIAETNNWK